MEVAEPIHGAVVSVIIPTYRRAGALGSAVRSALLQGAAVHEVLVVDDNRDEAESAKVAAVLSAIGDLRVRHLRNAGRSGAAAARNVGLRAATSPYVAFLDDDDYWLPGKLDAQLGRFTSGVVGVDCGYVEKDSGWGLLIEVRADGRLKSQADLAAGYCPTSSSLVMVRRSVALAAGLFDEGIVGGFEDYDFWLRCAAAGTFASLPEAKCVYIQHSGLRLSVALEGRLRGIEQFIERWRGQLGGDAQIAGFRSRWRLIAFITNARRSLSNARAESLRYAWSAVREFPTRFISWQSLFFAVGGFALARRVSQLRNRRRMPPAALVADIGRLEALIDVR